MFGWLKPRPPLDTGVMTWTELRIRGLVERLGLDRVRRASVWRPDDPALTAPIATDQDLRRLFERLGAQMGVATGTMELTLYDERNPAEWTAIEEATPSTSDGRTVVWVPLGLASDPSWIIATLVHELARAQLGTLPPARPDTREDGPVMDLLSVLLGLGVFTANTAAALEATDAHLRSRHWSRYQSRGELLGSPLLGYALSVFAHLRGEESPDWAQSLRSGPSDTFRAGLRYLTATGDTRCPPEAARSARTPLRPSNALEGLTTGTPGARLETLWRIRDESVRSPELVRALAALLGDRDRDLAAAAVEALGSQGSEALTELPALLSALRRGDDSVREAAARAVVQLRPPVAAVLPALEELTRAGSPRLAEAALRGLASYGPEAGPAARRLCEILVRAVVDCLDDLSATAADAIVALDGAASDVVQENLASLDPDVLRIVRMQLVAAHDRAAPPPPLQRS